MSQITNFLTLAIQAKKDGDRQVAQDFLLKVIQAEELNEQAWIHLAEVVDDPIDAMICLENAGVINPKNTYLKMRITSLQRQLGETTGPGTLGLPRFAEAEEFYRETTDDDSSVPALGKFLVDHYGLPRTDIVKAMRLQEEYRRKGDYRLLGQILVELGIATQSQIDTGIRLQQRAIDRAFVV